MLGYGFMGRAHSGAYRRLVHIGPPAAVPARLVSVAGRDRELVAEAATLLGFERAVTHWREVVADPEVQVFDNCGPNNLHAEPTIAAARAGKHVICEKPLGRTAEEALSVLTEVACADVQHMCGFNYRFVPAIRLARELLEAGDLGEVYQFRAAYLQDWGVQTSGGWRFDRDAAGSGAIGDLGVHIIDLLRFLVGEVETVSSAIRTFAQGRAVDDAFVALADVSGGVVATLEASRWALGRKNELTWELNASRGSVAFSLERPNELMVSDGAKGFTRRLVTEPTDPFMSWWWPPGHVIGWEHTFVHELAHFLGAVVGQNSVAPYGATLEDGYRAAEVCDAITRAAENGRREAVHDSWGSARPTPSHAGRLTLNREGAG
jgi:predicted dehydrogenase